MTFQGNIKDLQTSEVVDSTGDKVGKVGQVYLTNDSQEPSWVTVNTGLFGSRETFIPLAEAQYTDGRITVPYEKSFIKDAPNVDEDGEISHEEEAELYRYYGVQDPSGDSRGRDARTGDADRRGDVDGRDAALGAGAGAGLGAGAGAGLDRDGRRDGDLDRDGLGARGDRRDGDLDRDGLGARGDRDLDRDGLDARGDRRDGDLDRDRRTDAGQEGVTLHEERLNVGTERVETGRVRLRKYVTTETEQVEVPVEREEVVLERVPANGETGGRIGEDVGETEVSLHEDRPVVDKETVATEQVNVGKRTVQDTETVTGEVGREEVDIDDTTRTGVEGEGRGVRGDRDDRI